jgi:hypothetical protein
VTRNVIPFPRAVQRASRKRALDRATPGEAHPAGLDPLTALEAITARPERVHEVFAALDTASPEEEDGAGVTSGGAAMVDWPYPPGRGKVGWSWRRNASTGAMQWHATVTPPDEARSNWQPLDPAIPERDAARAEADARALVDESAGAALVAAARAPRQSTETVDARTPVASGARARGVAAGASGSRQCSAPSPSRASRATTSRTCARPWRRGS